jgi:cytochrome c
MSKHITRPTLALACLSAALTVPGIAQADATNDAAMKALALNSGCLICHHVETGSLGPNGMAPIGPNWEDVAVKYQGKKEAADALTKAVLVGSNPYSSHWNGKVSGLAMPPNAVAIKEADARKLVNWILALKK